MSNPNRAEKLHWSKLASIVGCIACRIDGIINTHVSIHHIDGRTKPGCHMKVLSLCDRHHQTGGESAPSIHPWKRRFVAAYGTEEYLRELSNEILNTQGVGGFVTAPAATETTAQGWNQGSCKGLPSPGSGNTIDVVPAK